jgi:tRNA(Leu) C34 or U34 (ribose-2'-O)-methylase TrmL/ketosteroid isomerase-like protein
MLTPLAAPLHLRFRVATRLAGMAGAADREALGAPAVGVGPWDGPWPDDPRYDRTLLADGDRRNVADRYRYWTVEAIRDDLRARSHPFHVAIENWRHDFNIGAVVRNVNAFAARAVHIVGARRWNRRGAMMTEAYLDVRHHPDVEALARWAEGEGLPLVGVDNLPGARVIHDAPLPRACVLLFGQEGPGLSEPARAHVADVLAIPQYGSTRSINAGAASAVALYEWCRRHAASTPEEQVVRALYDARAVGDLDAVRRLLHPRVVWREPAGDAAYTGTHLGPDAVIGDMLGSAMAATGGTFRLDLEQTTRHGPMVACHVRWSATRGERSMSGRETAVYRVADGLVVEACFHLDDPDATDAFFRD